MILKRRKPQLKFRNYKISVQLITTRDSSVFVPIYSSIFSPVFVDVLKLFPSDGLGGTFFDQGYFKVFEVEDLFMFGTGVYREGRVFPLRFREASPVGVRSLMEFLNCPAEVTVFIFAYVTLPQVNHIP